MSTHTQMIDAQKTIDAPAAIKVSIRGALINFEVDDSVPIEAACREVREHLGRFRELYAGGEVLVDIGRRMLFDEQQLRIRKVIESESGLSVRQFWCEPEILEAELQRIGDMLAQQSLITGYVPRSDEPAIASNPDEPADGPTAGSVDDHVPADAAVEPEPDGPMAGVLKVGGLSADGERVGVPALVVRGTCRAGEVLRLPGSAVILGNVNPGAQIIAVGDILVFGALRGLAHAGAEGDATATIVAMSAANPILRIAGYNWDAEEWGDIESQISAGRRGQGHNGGITASVRNRAVQVSPYQKNHGINHGGNPNER